MTKAASRLSQTCLYLSLRVFCSLLLTLILLHCPVFILPARGQSWEPAQGSGKKVVIPEKLRTPEQREAFRALQEVEELAATYPRLRVFAHLQRRLPMRKLGSAGKNGSSASRDARDSIWSEPTLYEAFLWLSDFGLVANLSLADLRGLAQNLMQILHAAGNLQDSPPGELGRIYIKDYFRRIADSSYPGKGSWLVFRFFLDAINELDGGTRRISILCNAYQETVSPASSSWLPDPERYPMQRSAVYPQRSNDRLAYHAYLIPIHFEGRSKVRTESNSLPLAGSAPSTRDNAAATDTSPLAQATTAEEFGGKNTKEIAPDIPDQSVRYRLSFIEQSELYAKRTLHPQYSNAKYLGVLRSYLRDGLSDNDREVLPAVHALSRRNLNADTYFLMQELIFYYYLLYLPDRCNYFIRSQQTHLQLSRANPVLKNLWRVQLPRLWATINAVRTRYSRKFEVLLPG